MRLFCIAMMGAKLQQGQMKHCSLALVFIPLYINAARCMPHLRTILRPGHSLCCIAAPPGYAVTYVQRTVLHLLTSEPSLAELLSS